MTKLTDNENRVLACLRASVEGSRETRADGTIWQETYLDNAYPHGMSVREFDGTLGSLQRKGFYRDTGDCFGLVRLEDRQNELSR